MKLDILGKSHLAERGESYTTHRKFAFKYGTKLLFAAVTSFVHGVFPQLFKYHSANTVIAIYKTIAARDRAGERPH